MAKRNFIPLVPSGTINADASVAQLEQDVLAMDSKVGELAEDIGDTEQEINQLKSQITEVESGFPQKTASGSIITIEDGADNVPVVSLVADVDPVQDLHGYDNPWPAGGGKNKFDPSVYSAYLQSDGSYIMTGGQATGIRSLVPSSLIGQAVTFSVQAKIPSGSTLGGIVVGAYINGALSLGTQVTASSYTTSYITFTPETAQDVVLVSYSSNGSQTMQFKEPQLEVGSSVTSFAPYSNICPISGFTGANVFDTGVNVWDEEWEVGNINGSGVPYDDNTLIRSKNLIPIKPSTSYAAYVGEGVAIYGYFYTADETFISWSSLGSTFTTPANAAFMRFKMNTAYGTAYKGDISINYPSTDTVYHAYTGHTVNISWETEAGTVYGGTLTLNQDGTADLTVTHKTVNLGTLDWQYDDNVGHERFQAVLSDVKPSGGTVASLWCSDYKVITAGEIYQHAYDFAIAIHGTLPQVWVYDTRYTDKTTFKTAMNGVQAVYELATPVAYHIENVELVKTLYGYNNIWANSGDIDLTYRCDPATFTSEQIRIMLNAMVAPVEATTTASKAYSVNDFLILNNVLYKVIANIANGGTITPNTNVSATTVGEQLTAILNS